MKKMFALFMSVLMCISLLLACGSNTATTNGTTKPDSSAESKETTKEKETDPEGLPYHAVFILSVPNDNWPDADMVNEKLKEIALRDLNIDLEVLQMTFSTSNAQIPMMLAGGEQLDIFNCPGGSTCQTYFDQAYIIDLLPYKEQLQPALDLLGEEDVMTGMMRGHLLGMPGQVERTHSYGMAVRTDILNAVGYREEDLIPCDYEQISDIFARVHEKYPEMQIMDGPKNNNTPATVATDTDALGDGYGLLDNYGQTLTVTNFYEGDNFKYKLGWVKQWYDAGYIRRDAASKTDSFEALVKAGNTFGGMCPMKPDSKAEKDDQCGYDMTILYFTEDMLCGYGGGGYTIGGTSADYKEAARLLNWMFTSREFNDTINWGIEGIHWVEKEDEPNVAMFPEGMNSENQTYHNSWGWAYPNQRIAHVWLGNQPDIYDIYAEAEQKSHRTKAYGFHFDNAEFQDTIGALDNLKDQYFYEIANSGDFELLEEYNKAMYRNSLQDLINEKQRQLDAWCRENGVSE